MLQNSVITKKYTVYSWPRFQSWMRTVPKETENEDESHKKNKIEGKTHWGLHAIWHFGDKGDGFSVLIKGYCASSMK